MSTSVRSSRISIPGSNRDWSHKLSYSRLNPETLAAPDAITVTSWGEPPNSKRYSIVSALARAPAPSLGWSRVLPRRPRSSAVATACVNTIVVSSVIETISAASICISNAQRLER